MRHRGGIELPDEDELAELETLLNPRPIDATPQPKREDDEE
jgi:hypothetical protein